MNRDDMLKKIIECELKDERTLDTGSINVAVQDAFVTLSGYVSNFVQMHTIEHAVMRIRGVRGLRSKLQIELPLSPCRLN